MILRPLLKFLLFHLPRLLFQVAGLLRVINRGKGAFRKALKTAGLLGEVVEELVKEFNPLKGVSFREITGFRWSIESVNGSSSRGARTSSRRARRRPD
ncbi:hypothetical protein [Thermococcus sp.]|uniref:hypothetical protein n=1 Tax=Thermococcus sp. TaxID=35749 RepID=UPI0025F95233|nr:hypothetical protein [Thermococcus sp.]